MEEVSAGSGRRLGCSSVDIGETTEDHSDADLTSPKTIPPGKSACACAAANHTEAGAAAKESAMCYGIRAEQAEPGREGASQPSTGLDRLRPRMVGVAAALLVAGFAAAALVERSPPPPVNGGQAAVAPVKPTAAILPAGLVEQTSSGMDDGVPSAPNESKGMGGDCHHGL